ncbi:ferrochelatase [Neptunomonas sp. XY-337]|uniref:ferrochelatase n=1 Tax=Neptunomonas sp. XY-337 TaxID=2561897 RepID=UPI0010A9E749|nr:ferrochelatase [Neptunomonas sp. XY-337]
MAEQKKTAVVLVNLGTPDKPDAVSVKRYLKEFLSDQRVVEGKCVKRLFWLAVLNGIILNLRPRKVAKLYQSIWEDDSPMRKILDDQVRDLQLALDQEGGNGITVFSAMTYGTPGLKDRLEELKEHGYRRVLVVPMYPQYSATTTAPIYDQVAQFQLAQRYVLDIRLVNAFYDHPLYIEALAQSIAEHRELHGVTDKLVISYHGIPKEYADKGDPYPEHCHATSALVTEKLGLGDDAWISTFQSRFGPKEWLQPYTDKTLQKLAKSGTQSVDVICPAFTADCLETLEEIAEENREEFEGAGGQTYRYIPALNSSPAFIHLLRTLVHEHAGDWVGQVHSEKS